MKATTNIKQLVLPMPLMYAPVDTKFFIHPSNIVVALGQCDDNGRCLRPHLFVNLTCYVYTQKDVENNFVVCIYRRKDGFHLDLRGVDTSLFTVYTTVKDAKDTFIHTAEIYGEFTVDLVDKSAFSFKSLDALDYRALEEKIGDYERMIDATQREEGASLSYQEAQAAIDQIRKDMAIVQGAMERKQAIFNAILNARSIDTVKDQIASLSHRDLRALLQQAEKQEVFEISTILLQHINEYQNTF